MKMALLFLLVLGLADCGGPPPPPPPTLVSVNVMADPHSNDGSPLSVRVYRLTSKTGFEAAQFFPLFNGDKVVLKDDLVGREDLLMAPGQSKTLSLTLNDKVEAIGLFGAYRDYDTLTWRATVAVPAHQSSVLTVTSGVSGLLVKIAPAP